MSLALPLATLGLFGTNDRALAMASLGTIYIVSVETYATDTDVYNVVAFAPAHSVKTFERQHYVRADQLEHIVQNVADNSLITVGMIGHFVQMRPTETFATIVDNDYGVVPEPDSSTLTVERI